MGRKRRYIKMDGTFNTLQEWQMIKQNIIKELSSFGFHTDALESPRQRFTIVVLRNGRSASSVTDSFQHAESNINSVLKHYNVTFYYKLVFDMQA